MKIFKNYRALFLWTLLFGTVSCSTQGSYNAKFLENVRGKTLRDSSGGWFWHFSTDGREINQKNEGTASFLEAVSDTRGIYKAKDGEGETAIEIFLGIEYKGGSSRMFINSDRRFVWDSFHSDIIIQ